MNVQMTYLSCDWLIILEKYLEIGLIWRTGSFCIWVEEIKGTLRDSVFRSQPNNSEATRYIVGVTSCRMLSAFGKAAFGATCRRLLVLAGASQLLPDGDFQVEVRIWLSRRSSSTLAVSVKGTRKSSRGRRKCRNVPAPGRPALFWNTVGLSPSIVLIVD